MGLSQGALPARAGTSRPTLSAYEHGHKSPTMETAVDASTSATGDRRQRARVYEIVLREGGPADVLRYVDCALLVDRWDDLVLPATVRTAWAPVVATRTEVPSS